MHKPCKILSPVKTGMLGIVDSNSVGIASMVSDSSMPRRRSMRRPTTAIARPATAMPIVLALTAKLMIAGEVR